MRYRYGWRELRVDWRPWLINRYRRVEGWFRRTVWDTKWGYWRLELKWLPGLTNLWMKRAYIRPMVAAINAPTPILRELRRT